MRYVEFASWRLSKVGLGTSQFANPGWGYGADYKPHALVRRALTLGITHFDTSSFYGAGHSERILGAIPGNVEGVLVATKLFNVAPSARLVMAQARASAEHLGGPLALCYLDWANPFINDRSLMAGMRRLRAEGLVAEVGVGSYDLARWQAAERHLGAPVLVNQVPYNLGHGNLPKCHPPRTPKSDDPGGIRTRQRTGGPMPVGRKPRRVVPCCCRRQFAPAPNRTPAGSVASIRYISPIRGQPRPNQLQPSLNGEVQIMALRRSTVFRASGSGGTGPCAI